MPHVTRPRIQVIALRTLAVGISSLAFGACSGGGGCSGTAMQPYDFPPDQAQVNGFQARLTGPALEFVEQNFSPIFLAAMPEGMGFCMPPSGQVNDVCGELLGTGYQMCTSTLCSSGAAGCQIPISVQSVNLDLVPPTGLDVRVEFSPIDVDLAAKVWLSAACGDCNVHLSTEGEPWPVVAHFEFKVDQVSQKTTLEMGEPEIDLSSVVTTISGINGTQDGTCNILNGVVNGLGLMSLFEGPVRELLTSAFSDFVCRQCDGNGDCPNGATCEQNVCTWTATSQCVPTPLGMEGLMNPRSLFPGSEGPVTDMALIAAAGHEVSMANDGLFLGGLMGFEASPSACVPKRAAPAWTDMAALPELGTNLRGNGQPYFLGMAVSESSINRALFGLFNSGATCLHVGGEVLGDKLSTGTFTLFFKSIGVLTGNKPSPVSLRFRPENPPELTFGAGTYKAPDGSGKVQVDDALVHLEWQDVGIDFYALVDERQVRLFSAVLQLVLDLNLDIDGAGQILIVMGDLNKAITIGNVDDGEILAEDLTMVESLFKVAISQFLPTLIDVLATPFDLPEFMGYRLALDSDSIKAKLTGDRFLMAFTALEPINNTNATLTLDTVLRSLRLNKEAAARVPARRFEEFFTPRVNLELAALGTKPGGAEFSYQLDRGVWSPFSPAKNVEVTDERLALEGQHEVSVRARKQGQPRTLDPVPASRTFYVDLTPATLSLVRAADGAALIQISDAVTPLSAMDLKYRLDDGAWRDLPGLILPSKSLEHARRLDVRAIDKSDVAVLASVTLGDAGQGPASDAAGGCGVSRAPVTWTWCGWLLLAVSCLRPRRSVKWVFAAVLALALGCGNNTHKACTPGSCHSGKICLKNGQCGSDGCAASSDCAAAECGAGAAFCSSDGHCSCGQCNDACSADQFCCPAAQACVAVPASICAALSCPTGQGPVLVDVGQIDTQCQLSDFGCECQVLPPLSEGVIGRYSDLAADAEGLVVSAYNETYGDLMVGRVAGGALTWTFVDGVPSAGAVTGEQSGPRHGMAEPGADVGRDSSLAVAANGDIHVAYFDATQGQLKYALGQQTPTGVVWASVAIDPDGRAGRYASISLDAEGRPAVAYMAADKEIVDVAAGHTRRYGQARLIKALSTAPLSSIQWGAPVVVAQSERDLPCGGPCASGECLEATLVCAEKTHDCAEDCSSSELCVSGQCVTVVKFSKLADWEYGAGLFMDSARHSNGDVAMVYYNRTKGNLEYRREVSGALGQRMVLDGATLDGTDNGDSGLYPDLLIDGQDHEHVVYVDRTENALRYLDRESETSTVIDDGVRADAGKVVVHQVGADAELFLDGAGTLHVVYMDGTSYDVLYATRAGDGTWSVEPVAGQEDPFNGSWGFFTNVTSWGGSWWISSFVIDNQTAPNARGLRLMALP